MKKFISSLFTAAIAATAFIGCEGNVDGADTDACYADPLKDGSGIEVICGSSSIGKLKNDTDPIKYTPGEEYNTFIGIKKVYKKIADDEKVLFILRHAERPKDDYSKSAHLTDMGRFQAQFTGEQIKGEEPITYLHSEGFARTRETVQNIAIGRNENNASITASSILNGKWYVKNEAVIDSIKSTGDWDYPLYTAWAYTGKYAETGAFYDFEKRSEELINTLVPNYESMSKYTIAASHDLLVTPLAIYVTNKKINLRFYEDNNNNWLNYMAGVAIIINSNNERRYVPVKGLDEGVMLFY